ncbi:hypothetical protein A0J61_09196 [Choanephora cucurbitarum]|uniref:FHA domain-containing protein n=1 Tax=Choanephora cucurbitarum TaxID=101091 RepID=A0A1C7N236_9FUNG|nr:hypothetical protein A0J61_09196 [Choanephora cucurbitarum]
MSIQNLATQETFPLAVGSTITLGRGSHGIHSPYISRKQVEITYLDDHRCFVKKVSDRIMLLNDAALPFQQEFQLKNGDVLGFPISNEAEVK